MAPLRSVPQALQESNGATLRVAAVVTTHHRLDSFACLVGMVEGNETDIMVENVGFDDSMEELSTNESEFAVDCRRGTTGVGPSIRSIVRKRRVGMLKECDRNQPVINPKVGQDVPHKQVRPAKVLANSEENAACDQETQIAEKDQLRIFRFVQWTRGIEVVDTLAKTVLLAFAATFALALVVVVSSHVGQKVIGPSSELLVDEMTCCCDWCLLGQFRQLVDGTSNTSSIVVPRLWYEDHVTLEMPGGFVVLAVRNLPREVWDEQRRVTDPTDGVIQDLGR